MDECLKYIPRLVADDINEKLFKPVSDEEIKKAIDSLGELKAPGPDGYNGLFFKKKWDTVGKDVCQAIQSFFNGEDLPPEINETIMSLVPKISIPKILHQLRPISCCNFIPKVLSKIIHCRHKVKKFRG